MCKVHKYEVERIILIKCVEGRKDTMQHRSRKGACRNSQVEMERIRTTLWRTIRIVPKEVIFQVKGQRQTKKHFFEKKVFFACFFSAQNGEWARKAGKIAKEVKTNEQNRRCNKLHHRM